MPKNKLPIPQLFVFTKQSNGDLKAVVNLEYLVYHRWTHGMGIEERKRLDIATWNEIRTKLSTMTDQEKRDLVRREWKKDIYQEQDIPKYVEDEFLRKLSGKKSILIK